MERLECRLPHKDDVSDLSNDRFNSNLELRQFVADYQSPEALFDILLQPKTASVLLCRTTMC